MTTRGGSTQAPETPERRARWFRALTSVLVREQHQSQRSRRGARRGGAAQAAPAKGASLSAAPFLPLDAALEQGGHAPFVALRVDGRIGDFLIDTAATQSSLNAEFFPIGATRLVRHFSLPSFPGGVFSVADYVGLRGPSGSKLGILGTDFLSLLSMRLAYDGPNLQVGVTPASCNGRLLREAGFIAIDQKGFFSADQSLLGPGRPNVPILRMGFGGELRFWAQIDSGYDDRLYQPSIDVNAPLFEALKAAGAKMTKVDDVTLTTCVGRESRAIWRMERGGLDVFAEAGPGGAPVAAFAAPYLSVKQPNGCGGIAGLDEPAAQLGASVLRSFGEVVFDPKNTCVWIPGHR
ncbi:MAG: hypothetical protein AAF909_05430 [Pseudomonadota bacterium]